MQMGPLHNIAVLQLFKWWTPLIPHPNNHTKLSTNYFIRILSIQHVYIRMWTNTWFKHSNLLKPFSAVIKVSSGSIEPLLINILVVTYRTCYTALPNTVKFIQRLVYSQKTFNMVVRVGFEPTRLLGGVLQTPSFNHSLTVPYSLQFIWKMFIFTYNYTTSCYNIFNRNAPAFSISN